MTAIIRYIKGTDIKYKNLITLIFKENFNIINDMIIIKKKVLIDYY